MRCPKWTPSIVFALLIVGGTGLARAQDETPPLPDPAAPFFDDSVVHDVRLTINTRDWLALKTHYLENTYYPCDMRWQDLVVRNVGIRSRGTGSRSGVKPGLRVDFNRYTSGQEFLGLKSFVLRNNTQDPSDLRERLSMLFFRRMGLPAPREAHTRLWVNNEYAGLYMIVESIDKVLLKKTFGDNDGYLYEYDYDPEDQPYYFEFRGSDPATYVPKPFKPETHESDPRGDVIVELIQRINEGSAETFRAAIADFLDVGRFVRHIAIEIFLADNDGLNGNWGMNNFYLYRFTDRNLFTFLPWDKSNAFLDGPEYPIWHNIYDVPPEARNRLTMRVLEQPDLREAFLETLAECARSAGEVTEESPDAGWLAREVERESAQIRDDVYNDPDKPFTNDEFEQAVEALRVFARDRGAFVAGEIAAARGVLSNTSSAGRRRRVAR